MKKLLYALLFCVAHQAYGQRVTVLMDETALGMWADDQYDEICNTIFALAKSEKLQARDLQGKKLGALELDNKLRLISYFDPDTTDPVSFERVWSDLNVFYKIGLGNEHIEVVAYNDASHTFFIPRQDFMPRLSHDNQLFIDIFAVNNVIIRDSLATKSKLVLQSINLKLIDHALKESTMLFKNDSLVSQYALHEKEEKTKYEVSKWIDDSLSNDPGDGYEINFKRPCNFKDTSSIQGIFVTLQMDGLNFGVLTVSPGYHPIFGGIYCDNTPFGYLEYRPDLPLTPAENNLLNCLLRYTMRKKLEDRK